MFGAAPPCLDRSSVTERDLLALSEGRKKETAFLLLLFLWKSMRFHTRHGSATNRHLF